MQPRQPRVPAVSLPITRRIPGTRSFVIARDGRVWRVENDEAIPQSHGLFDGIARVIVTLDDGRRSSRRIANLLAALWPEGT